MSLLVVFKNEILLASGLCPISPKVLLVHWLGILLSVQGTLWHHKKPSKEKKQTRKQT